MSELYDRVVEITDGSKKTARAVILELADRHAIAQALKGHSEDPGRVWPHQCGCGAKYGNYELHLAAKVTDWMLAIIPPDIEPARYSETVHRCPLGGQLYTPCCARTVLELPRQERVTIDADAVTCTG